MIRLVLLSALLSLAAAAPREGWRGQPRCTALPTVSLASGAVVGTTTQQPISWATGISVTVEKFLGVPYAAPPVRFAPPEDVAPWQGQINATAFKPSCYQFFNSSFLVEFADTPPVPESEDCLYANIWTPSGEPADPGGRPVMFWIYGGGLTFGYAGDSDYEGASLAASEDVIVVSIGYRLNVFGFSNSPEVPFGQQNSGFLDQRKALEWVQENIAQFGGNPRRVTAWGESAGGFSVKQLLANPPSPLPFSAAIIESPGTYATNGTPDSWTTLTKSLGCATATSPLACMRALPVMTIQNATENLHTIFNPVPDNITSSYDVRNQINSGKFANVPVLTGDNANEGTFFSLGQNNLTAYVDRLFPASLRQSIIDQYPPNSDQYQDISDIYTYFLSVCQTSDLTQLAASKGYTFYRYFFNASFPNYQPFPGAGVWHTSEIALIFGTYPRVNDTQQQIDLSIYFQRVWADFARFHTPGWPKVLGAANYIMDIGVNGSCTGVLVGNDTVDYKCPIYQPVIAHVGL